MFYQLGVLFIFGSMSVTSALPPCVCTRNLRPVCGSDGKTYSNECRLQCAQLSNPDLFLEKQGSCELNAQGPGDCICTLEYKPVCGTNGVTYGNPCGLSCAQRSEPVKLAYNGECRVKRDICICTLEYKPVCGTNGVTYGNPCGLSCAQRSEPVKLAYNGECRVKRESVQVAEPPSCVCPRDERPVCGSDGKTYANSCILNCSKRVNSDLRVEHEGSCGSSGTPCICTREVKPVCGSDRNTYNNPCMLKCAMETNSNLNLDHHGECDNGVKVVEQPAECICTREAKPVCGTDGNTYNNPCMLNCARERDESLHIDHVGRCESVKIVDNANNISCACTRNLKPVCASNGVTFSNECLMRCSGTHLTVAKEGPCEE